MRQVRTVLEMPRDYAYSRLYECHYLYPLAGPYNFITVFNKVFLVIDASLVAALIRKVENE